ncbi:Crp/Fnr family transcriptional regulator [Umezawaea beigongshangensis]|uniref:Crp/Fnr family transcriptional regulator n=1 Tax=Umezawaea beigongshangensis TaxID=2780383 RepID=UPI0027DC91CC|nr:Crp/Fnr family transcriptional regulator [Umezawaea beigongshangensis]
MVVDEQREPHAVEPDTFWGLLGPADRAALLRQGVLRAYRAGAVICTEGEFSQRVFVVHRGRIVVTSASSAGRSTVLAVRGPGEILGELSAVDGGPRMATLHAVDEVGALVLPASAFAALCREHPHVAWAVLHVVISRQRELDRQRQRISGTATQRVAAALVDVASPRGTGSSGDLIATIALSQEELAGIAGTSRESLVRVLRDLREQGVVRTGRRRITVLRPDRLRVLAGS